MTVTGAGTVVTNNGGTKLGHATGATLNVENGGQFLNGSKTTLVFGAGTVAAINVTGEGSLYRGSINSVRGTSTIKVTDGGHIKSHQCSRYGRRDLEYQV